MSVKESLEGFWLCIKLAGVFFVVLGFGIGRISNGFGLKKKCRGCQDQEGPGQVVSKA
jgi:hypothetical protein